MRAQTTITPREVNFPTPTWPKAFPLESERFFDTWNKFFNGFAYRPFEMVSVPEQTFQIPVEIAETEKELLVTAEVPGFTEKDLEVRIEPGRLFLTGRLYENKEEKGKKMLYTERTYNQIFRYVDLPIQVNPNDATATVKDGVLKITVHKAQPPKLVPISTIS